MSRKKLFGIMLVFVCVIVVVLRVRYIGYGNLGQSTENPPQNDPPELPDGPIFVVPENPLGVLGVIIALVIAFGISAKANKMLTRK